MQEIHFVFEFIDAEIHFMGSQMKHFSVHIL